MYVYLPPRSPVSGPGAFKHEALPLIDSGLQTPQGLASDQKHSRLFIADPEAKKVLQYTLKLSAGKAVTVQTGFAVAVADIEARWVACDGDGSLFISDERNNKIVRVSAQSLLRKDSMPTLLYSGAVVSQVSTPGGVAVDNYHVFWSNKAEGGQVGSVVKGVANRYAEQAESLIVLASNAPKVYGLCHAEGNIFYTGAETSLYGVKAGGGGEAVTVSDKLLEPRGCVWDGDGTIFVADRKANKIFGFAGNMRKLTQASLADIVEFEDAFGVAVMSVGGRLQISFSLAILLTVLVFS